MPPQLEETRRKIEAEYAEKQKAEADKKRADDEARAKAEQEAEARRKAIEFVEGNAEKLEERIRHISQARGRWHLSGPKTTGSSGSR